MCRFLLNLGPNQSCQSSSTHRLATGPNGLRLNDPQFLGSKRWIRTGGMSEGGAVPTGLRHSCGSVGHPPKRLLTRRHSKSRKSRRSLRRFLGLQASARPCHTLCMSDGTLESFGLAPSGLLPRATAITFAQPEPTGARSTLEDSRKVQGINAFSLIYLSFPAQGEGSLMRQNRVRSSSRRRRSPGWALLIRQSNTACRVLCEESSRSSRSSLPVSRLVRPFPHEPSTADDSS